MRRLTIKQRAQRATNRINRVVAVKYPLLAEQLSTTVAEQEQRIAQKDADFQTHWGKLQEFDEAISELGIDRREAVRNHRLDFSLRISLDNWRFVFRLLDFANDVCDA